MCFFSWFSKGFWSSFGRDLEALKDSWAVSRGLRFMLVFGVVFKNALGGIWAGYCCYLEAGGR